MRKAMGVLLLFAAVVARAADDSVTMRFNVEYHQCVSPEGLTCYVGIEGDRNKKCPKCVDWRKAEIHEDVVTTLNFDQYDGTKNAAGRMLRDIQADIARAMPDGPGHAVPTFEQLAASPEKFGYIEVRASEQSTDGFAVSPKIGGVARRIGSVPIGDALHLNTDYRLDYYSASTQAVKLDANPGAVFGKTDAKLLIPIQALLSRAPRGPSMYWNAWAAELPPGPATHLTTLRLKHRYQLNFSLANTRDGADAGGDVGGEILEYVKKWLTDHPEETNAPIRVLLLTDEHFAVQGNPVVEGTLSLAGVRNWLAATAGSLPGEAAEFARVPFEIVPQKKGRGAVTFAIWSNTYRPLDEVSAEFCVDECSGTPVHVGSVGLDSAHAASAEGEVPLAALQFVMVGGEVHGIMHRRDAADGDEFSAWKVASSRDAFMRAMTSAMSDFAVPGNTAIERRRAADNLRMTLFPDETDDDSAAREQFDLLLQEHASATPPKGSDAPAIFVRMIGVTSDDALAIPLGAYPFRDPVLDEELDYLGFFYRVEAPLELQNYDPSPQCLSSWFLTYSATGDLPELGTSAAWLNKRVVDAWPKDSYKYYPTFAAGLKDWIVTPDAEPRTDDAIVYILGHYGKSDEDGEYLVIDRNDKLKASDIKRKFARSSLAILNACGTARPSSQSFIHKLNLSNVGAIIATKHEVQFQMAAQFTSCLAQQLTAPGGTAAPALSFAFFDAIACLRQVRPFDEKELEELEGEPQWGSRALAYSLLGNGGLRVCTPGQKEKTSHATP
jgi:hypothetical protein